MYFGIGKIIKLILKNDKWQMTIRILIAMFMPEQELRSKQTIVKFYSNRISVGLVCLSARPHCIVARSSTFHWIIGGGGGGLHREISTQINHKCKWESIFMFIQWSWSHKQIAINISNKTSSQLTSSLAIAHFHWIQARECAKNTTTLPRRCRHRRRRRYQNEKVTNKSSDDSVEIEDRNTFLGNS